MDFGQTFGNFVKGVGGVLALPFNGFNTQPIAEAAGYRPPAPPKPQLPSWYGTGELLKAPQQQTDYGNLQKQLADSAAQLKALQYQIAQQPKIYNYDVAGAYARARSAAEGAVNPFYAKKLNDFLAQQETKKQRTNEDAATANTNIEQGLADALQASDIARQRTTEDTATNLGNIQNAENYYQNTEGTQFDRARQALLSQGAQSGLLGSGLGAQQDINAINDRNVASAQQEQGYNTQRQAAQLFKTRTFEDLTRSDSLANRNAGQQKKQVQVNLDRALQDIGTESEAYKYQNEADRIGAVLQEQNRQAQLGYANFIAGLQGQGAKARDIEATANIYGKLFG